MLKGIKASAYLVLYHWHLVSLYPATEQAHNTMKYEELVLTMSIIAAFSLIALLFYFITRPQQLLEKKGMTWDSVCWIC